MALQSPVRAFPLVRPGHSGDEVLETTSCQFGINPDRLYDPRSAIHETTPHSMSEGAAVCRWCSLGPGWLGRD